MHVTAVKWRNLEQPNLVAFSANCETRMVPFVLNLNTFIIQPVITRSKANMSDFDVLPSGEMLVLYEDEGLHIVKLDQSKIMATSCVSYLCWSCGDDFRDKLSLGNHSVMHDNIPAQCDVCLTAFRDKVFMARHRKSCFLKCDNCEFKSKYPGKIKSHTKSLKCN